MSDNAWTDEWANEHLAPLIKAGQAEMAKALADQAETIMRYLKTGAYGDPAILLERTDDYDSMKDWTGEDL